MKHFVALPFIFIYAILFASSCCGDLDECQNLSPIVLKVVGYDQAEIDTFIVHKYDEEASFIDAISTTIAIGDFEEYHHLSTVDTICVRIDHDFQHGFAWKIVIPETTEELRLNDLTYDVTEETCQGVGAKKDKCINYLISAEINGLSTTFSNDGEPRTIVIVKN